MKLKKYGEFDNEYDFLIDWFIRLRKSKAAILVEGKEDKAALKRFDIPNVFALTRPSFQVVENIEGRFKKAVILSDLDKEGKKIYGRVSKELQDHGIQIDHILREELFRYTQLRQIEGMIGYFKRLDQERHPDELI